MCDHLPFSNRPYVDKLEVKNRTSDIKHDQVCLIINYFYTPLYLMYENEHG